MMENRITLREYHLNSREQKGASVVSSPSTGLFSVYFTHGASYDTADRATQPSVAGGGVKHLANLW